MKKICIVTTRHISYNPRVLKEADTLHSLGYRVTVVTINNHATQSGFDDELMRSRQWTLKTVNFRKTVPSEKRRWFRLSLRQRFYHLLSHITLRFGIAERTAEKAFDELAFFATNEHADFYIAHHAEALGAASIAAAANHTGFGFDAEDFHTGMEDMSPAYYSLITFLEQKYLPRCQYLTAAADGIAAAYADKYGVKTPVTILNVFPKEETQQKPAHSPVRFYWYSQVIGPKRGLEMLLEAAGLVPEPFELHLRGSWHSDNYKRDLEKLAAECGCAEKLFFHDPILAKDIIADAANYDVGLALELDVSVNKYLAVSNKLFSYLMSGLALIMTDTDGQKNIYARFPAAGRLCRMNDTESLAGAMRFFIEDAGRLMAAKKAAREAAETRFNWENESATLLENIKHCLA